MYLCVSIIICVLLLEYKLHKSGDFVYFVDCYAHYFWKSVSYITGTQLIYS